MKFKHGLELIKQIGLERAKIIKAKSEYENVEAAILKINKFSIMKQMYEEQKALQSEVIEGSRSKARDCYQELMDMKGKISLEQWHHLLEFLGFTLAKNDYIIHIEDCLNRPDKLKMAISDTIVTIKRKNKRREQAMIKNDEDRVIILSSEIAYYENDLKKHPLGIAALEEYNIQEKVKRSNHERKK